MSNGWRGPKPLKIGISNRRSSHVRASQDLLRTPVFLQTMAPSQNSDSDVTKTFMSKDMLFMQSALQVRCLRRKGHEAGQRQIARWERPGDLDYIIYSKLV